jgi:hypothetical protein
VCDNWKKTASNRWEKGIHTRTIEVLSYNVNGQLFLSTHERDERKRRKNVDHWSSMRHARTFVHVWREEKRKTPFFPFLSVFCTHSLEDEEKMKEKSTITNDYLSYVYRFFARFCSCYHTHMPVTCRRQIPISKRHLTY